MKVDPSLQELIKPFIAPLLEPSSPRITLMEEMICSAAGGDIDVP